jgi:hypothetical protein
MERNSAHTREMRTAYKILIGENKKGEILKRMCENVDWIPLSQHCPRMGFSEKG